MHYYPHHIGDFLRDTSSLSHRDAYVYLRLIWLYYESEKPLPDDPEVLAYKVGVRGEEQLISLLLRTFFTYDPDLKSHTHHRIDAEIAKYQRKASSARQANQSRWASERDLKSDAVSDPSQIATNNQEPVTKNQEPKEDAPKSRRVTCPEDVSEEVWSAYMAVRKAKRAPITELALKANRREAAAAGLTLEQALTFCCEANWQAFNSQWWRDRTAKTSVGKQSALEARNAAVVRQFLASKVEDV